MLGLSQYGEKALKMALHDPEAYARNSALLGLGRIINDVDKKLAKEIAVCLYEVLTNKDSEKYNTRSRECASGSIFEAINFTGAKNSGNFDPIWKEFLKKYKLEYKPVFRR